MTCPNLKSLDLRKITQEMRETNTMPIKDKITLTHGGSKGIEDSNDKKDNGNVSTDISPDKISNPTNNGGAPINSDDISPEGLLEVIS
jgi:hypothetical protein